MSSTGTTTCELERLAHAGVDDGHRARRRRAAALRRRRPEPATEEGARPPTSGRCVAERPIRCGLALGERLQPLEREREVGAALRAGERVDLVDDDPLDRRAAPRALPRSAAGRATRAW